MSTAIKLFSLQVLVLFVESHIPMDTIHYTTRDGAASNGVAMGRFAAVLDITCFSLVGKEFDKSCPAACKVVTSGGPLRFPAAPACAEPF